MKAEAFYGELRSAVALVGERAVIRISSTYEPAGGPGSRVYPPTYPTDNGQSPYLVEERFFEGVARPDVVLDTVPSQANRAEEALLRARRSGRVDVPLLELRHSGSVEVVLTSLEFPHRYADAYLRDSLLGGVKFDYSDLGKSMLAATLADATALYAHDPGSLVFGAWNSHRKGRQQKFPRAYSSEIVGWDPQLGKRAAGRMDPINLVGSAKQTSVGDWDYAPSAEKVKGERLSEIGHGNVAPGRQHGGVTISSASRMATVSLAGLDRIGFGDASHDAAVAARAVLAAYALVADRLAFGGPSIWLRSGCELVLVDERLEWVNRGGGTESFDLPVQAALDVFAVAVERAAKESMPISTDTVQLAPSTSLAKAIDFSLTKAESTGE
jgi:CRISPR-associated protein Csb1